MWNKSVKLVTGIDTETDEDGFDTVKEKFLEGIPADFKDLTRSDDVVANQLGYSADQNIEIASCNYNGEKFLYDEETGEKYEVKRTFRGDKKMNIILTCQRRECGGKI